MKVSEFNYELPESLIAQHPIEKRDESRLMVLSKENKTIEHKVFKEVIEYLNPGDCLVINNTKVIPARLYGDRGEILLLKNLGEDIWECIVKPRKEIKTWCKNRIRKRAVNRRNHRSVARWKQKNKICIQWNFS